MVEMTLPGFGHDGDENFWNEKFITTVKATTGISTERVLEVGKDDISQKELERLERQLLKVSSSYQGKKPS